jgi:hypothetical protein
MAYWQDYLKLRPIMLLLKDFIITSFVPLLALIAFLSLPFAFLKPLFCPILFSLLLTSAPFSFSFLLEPLSFLHLPFVFVIIVYPTHPTFPFTLVSSSLTISIIVPAPPIPFTIVSFFLLAVLLVLASQAIAIFPILHHYLHIQYRLSWKPSSSSFSSFCP